MKHRYNNGSTMLVVAVIISAMVIVVSTMSNINLTVGKTIRSTIDNQISNIVLKSAVNQVKKKIDTAIAQNNNDVPASYWVDMTDNLTYLTTFDPKKINRAHKVYNVEKTESESNFYYNITSYYGGLKHGYRLAIRKQSSAQEVDFWDYTGKSFEPNDQRIRRLLNNGVHISTEGVKIGSFAYDEEENILYDSITNTDSLFSGDTSNPQKYGTRLFDLEPLASRGKSQAIYGDTSNINTNSTQTDTIFQVTPLFAGKGKFFAQVAGGSLETNTNIYRYTIDKKNTDIGSRVVKDDMAYNPRNDWPSSNVVPKNKAFRQIAKTTTYDDNMFLMAPNCGENVTFKNVAMDNPCYKSPSLIIINKSNPDKWKQVYLDWVINKDPNIQPWKTNPQYYSLKPEINAIRVFSKGLRTYLLVAGGENGIGLANITDELKNVDSWNSQDLRRTDIAFTRMGGPIWTNQEYQGIPVYDVDYDNGRMYAAMGGKDGNKESGWNAQGGLESYAWPQDGSGNFIIQQNNFVLSGGDCNTTSDQTATAPYTGIRFNKIAIGENNEGKKRLYVANYGFTNPAPATNTNLVPEGGQAWTNTGIYIYDISSGSPQRLGNYTCDQANYSNPSQWLTQLKYITLGSGSSAKGYLIGSTANETNYVVYDTSILDSAASTTGATADSANPDPVVEVAPTVGVIYDFTFNENATKATNNSAASVGKNTRRMYVSSSTGIQVVDLDNMYTIGKKNMIYVRQNNYDYNRDTQNGFAHNKSKLMYYKTTTKEYLFSIPSVVDAGGDLNIKRYTIDTDGDLEGLTFQTINISSSSKNKITDIDIGDDGIIYILSDETGISKIDINNSTGDMTLDKTKLLTDLGGTAREHFRMARYHDDTANEIYVLNYGWTDKPDTNPSAIYKINGNNLEDISSFTMNSASNPVDEQNTGDSHKMPLGGDIAVDKDYIYLSNCGYYMTKGGLDSSGNYRVMIGNTMLLFKRSDFPNEPKYLKTYWETSVTAGKSNMSYNYAKGLDADKNPITDRYKVQTGGCGTSIAVGDISGDGNNDIYSGFWYSFYVASFFPLRNGGSPAWNQAWTNMKWTTTYKDIQDTITGSDRIKQVARPNLFNNTNYGYGFQGIPSGSATDDKKIINNLGMFSAGSTHDGASYITIKRFDIGDSAPRIIESKKLY